MLCALFFFKKGGIGKQLYTLIKIRGSPLMCSAKYLTDEQIWPSLKRTLAFLLLSVRAPCVLFAPGCPPSCRDSYWWKGGQPAFFLSLSNSRVLLGCQFSCLCCCTFFPLRFRISHDARPLHDSTCAFYALICPPLYCPFVGATSYTYDDGLRKKKLSCHTTALRIQTVIDCRHMQVILVIN